MRVRLAATTALVGIAALAAAARAADVAVTEAADTLHADGCAKTGQPPCTLRDAITFANARHGPDTITFSIGSGPVTIRLTSPLPPITDPVVLDGARQPGWAGSPIVELDGSGAGDEAAGLRIKAGASTVQGLVLNRFRSTALAAIVLEEKGGNLIRGNEVGTDATGTASRGNRGTGILVQGDRNTIGGTVAAARNVVSGNTGDGIRVQGAGNTIVGNLVGTDASGTRALGNQGDGISAQGGNTIGGSAPGARNVVGGNGRVGIAAGPSETIAGNFVGTDAAGAQAIPNARGGITGGGRIGGDGARPGGPCSADCNLVSGNGGPGVAPASGAAISGNFIGTDVSGTAALPNAGAGIAVSGATRVTIGGGSPGARNLVSGNAGPGVLLTLDAESAVLLGNVIGADTTERAPLPNADGVRVSDRAHKNRIGADSPTDANIIAFNTGAGVVLESSTGNGNAILGNAIFLNGALGIDLSGDGVSANHGPEATSGPNAMQNFPVLTVVTPFSVEGTLDSTPHTGFTLQFFTNTACDPSGYGQGETRIASTTVSTDAGGHADFGVSLTAPPGQGVTATATDSTGNTSEFSPCILAGVEGEEPEGSVP